MPLFEEPGYPRNNEVEVVWSSSVDPVISSRQESVVLSMGRYASIDGRISSHEPRTLHTGLLWVKHSCRGQGIGEHLSRRLIVEAKERGVETVETLMASQYSLDIAARLFGRDRLQFYHQNPDKPVDLFPEMYMELPIEFDQARASLERSERSEPFRGMLKNFIRINGFKVVTDIRGLDISDEKWQTGAQ